MVLYLFVPIPDQLGALILNGLTLSCLEISWTDVVWIYDSFENIFVNIHKLLKYLKESF